MCGTKPPALQNPCSFLSFSLRVSHTSRQRERSAGAGGCRRRGDAQGRTEGSRQRESARRAEPRRRQAAHRSSRAAEATRGLVKLPCSGARRFLRLPHRRLQRRRATLRGVAHDVKIGKAVVPASSSRRNCARPCRAVLVEALRRPLERE
jgi:hypothetical protein